MNTDGQLRDTIEEFRQLWQECRSPNWDGYDALPVQINTVKMAYRLLDSLPCGFPLPTLGAEPDGLVTLEWWMAPNRTISVSVDPSGHLHYAGLVGDKKRYGTIVFFSAAPPELIQMIQEL